jgi:hypothetical protein
MYRATTTTNGWIAFKNLCWWVVMPTIPSATTSWRCGFCSSFTATKRYKYLWKITPTDKPQATKRLEIFKTQKSVDDKPMARYETDKNYQRSSSRLSAGHRFHRLACGHVETLVIGGSFYYQLFFSNLSMCSNRFSMCLCVKNGFSKTVRNHRLFLYFGKERKKSVSFTK